MVVTAGAEPGEPVSGVVDCKWALLVVYIRLCYVTHYSDDWLPCVSRSIPKRCMEGPVVEIGEIGIHARRTSRNYWEDAWKRPWRDTGIKHAFCITTTIKEDISRLCCYRHGWNGSPSKMTNVLRNMNSVPQCTWTLTRWFVMPSPVILYWNYAAWNSNAS